MKYKDFEDAFSIERIKRYIIACEGNKQNAMKLYRNNLRLSQEIFTLINCFEVTLRNRIDRQMTIHFGNDWLRDLILPHGAFWNNHAVETTRKIIENAYQGLLRDGNYSHSKLLSEMEFGVWKYMFSNVQYRLTGRVLLDAFPMKPTSSAQHQYDNVYIFHELDYINHIRNRIAHHEPICFGRSALIDTTYALNRYALMIKLLKWMDIDAAGMLYGLDHINFYCDKIMKI